MCDIVHYVINIYTYINVSFHWLHFFPKVEILYSACEGTYYICFISLFECYTSQKTVKPTLNEAQTRYYIKIKAFTVSDEFVTNMPSFSVFTAFKSVNTLKLLLISMSSSGPCRPVDGAAFKGLIFTVFCKLSDIYQLS